MNIEFQLSGTGHALGSQVVSNVDTALGLGLAEDWFVRRTGIEERRVCGTDETVLTLSAAAVRNACNAAEIAVADIGPETVILHIQNGMTCLTPPSGIVLAAELGIAHSRIVAIDGVCAEPIPALEYASLLLSTGRCDRVIVSAAADFLPIVRPDDVATVGLFGAGAAAVVLTAPDGPKPSTIQGLRWETWPSHAKLGQIPITGYEIDDDGISIHAGFYEMDGGGLARVALAVLPEVVDDVLTQADWDKNDVSVLIAHQPNARMLALGVQALGFDPGIVPTPVVRLGNMGPASLLVALSLAHQEGRLLRDSKILLVAFGLGFSCGAMAIEL